MRKHAMREREQLVLGEAVELPRALCHELLTERQVADHRARLAERDLGAKLELDRLAEVMHDRRADEQIRVQARDRKSTRLNSSHTVISYAVFCLKKKKKVKNRLTLIIKKKTE